MRKTEWQYEDLVEQLILDGLDRCNGLDKRFSLSKLAHELTDFDTLAGYFENHHQVKDFVLSNVDYAYLATIDEEDMESALCELMEHGVSEKLHESYYLTWGGDEGIEITGESIEFILEDLGMEQDAHVLRER